MKNCICALVFLFAAFGACSSALAMDFNLFGPKTFGECRQKYAWDTNKVDAAKAAIAFACYAKFNTDPTYLSHLSSDQKEAVLDSAACLLSHRDEVYSPDSALKVSTACADKYSSRIFVPAVNSAMFPKRLDE